MTFSFNDKYDQNTGTHILTGVNALVKLPMIQRIFDKEDKLNTRGFISGYRGSPLGGFDQQCQSAKKYFDEYGIDFRWGLNENLAAASVSGTQALNISSPSEYDGVFGIFYAKGPGIDQAGDGIHHFNFSGTQKHGGVLILAGDDHTCKSSTLPHATDETLKSWFVPSFVPANVDDLLKFGTAGIALSRYSGLWTSMKVIADICDSTQVVEYDFKSIKPVVPSKQYDVEARWPDSGLAQEKRIHTQKLPAVQEFLKHNKINEIIQQPSHSRLGIVVVGEAYNALMSALDVLGKEVADKISILKIGMSWPLQKDIVTEFAFQHEKLLVIEEKGPLVEDQIKQILYDEIGGGPEVNGSDVFTPIAGITTTNIIEQLDKSRIKTNKSKLKPVDLRTPHFCSGCPHNTSTKVPEGSIASVGIGCHYIARYNNYEQTIGLAHMGAEGTPWIGTSDYVEHDHIFINLGDGTYYHSGLLAIRAAVAQPNVNITYKILKNDAVAMTGGQAVMNDNPLTTQQIIDQVVAEGVLKENIAYVAEDLVQFSKSYLKSLGVSYHDKSEFNDVQESFKDKKGISIIIFDKQCATDKRRKLKRGLQEATERDTTTVLINSDVCEGCGDCTVKSKCLSILPKETELGTKRQVNQESCNKDMSCVDGFCPSFITIPGATRKVQAETHSDMSDAILEDMYRKLEKPIYNKKYDRYNILLSGIGGTGVMTVSQILVLAGFFDDQKVYSVDQTGLAQKFGAVTSHISLGKNARGRINDTGADLILGADSQTTGSEETTKFINKKTNVVLNMDSNPGIESLLDPNWTFNSKITSDIVNSLTKNVFEVQAMELSKKLVNNSISSTIFMLGMAYQLGKLPIDEASILKAINVFSKDKTNLDAWTWGRIYGNNNDEVISVVEPKKELMSYDKALAHRIDILTQYGGEEYSNQYRKLIMDTNMASSNQLHLSHIMLNLFEAMYIKDDYEISRLWANSLQEMTDQYDNVKNVYFHMSLPWQRSAGKKTKLNARYMLPLFKLLQHGRHIRNKWYDILSRNEERKLENEFKDTYIKWVEEYIATGEFDFDKMELPSKIKGFGHVKLEKFAKYKATIK